jgi:hypothetical protein
MTETVYNMTHTIFSMVDNNGKIEIIWNYQVLSKESQEAIKVINMVYPDRDFIWLNDNRKKLKPKKERTCRFCGKSFPEVKFSKRAHTIPESIGNKFHLSDFECDTCNSKFGNYENDFANFLGPYRTIAELSGKKGVPKYKSRDKELSIEQAYKNAIDVKLNKMNIKNNIIYKKGGSGLRIQIEGDPYTPINAFKCLLKSAISLVDDEDLKHLSNSIKFLLDDNYITDPSNDFILSVNKFFVPGNFTVPPFLLQYKKGINFIGFPAPSMIFIFYMRNLIIQLFIPFHDKDSFISNAGNKKQLYIVPPLLKGAWFDKFGGPFPTLVNLNSSDVFKNNAQVYEWKFRRK